MIQLSEAEMAILNFWRGFICTGSDKTVRPTLVYYLMAEILIDYYGNLPKDKRPQRPSEAALNSIDCYPGTFSKWRKKWQTVWFSLPKNEG